MATCRSKARISFSGTCHRRFIAWSPNVQPPSVELSRCQRRCERAALTGGVMRSLFVVMLAVVAAAAPAVAADTERGFVSGIAGFATSPDGTSGNVLGEAAVRVAPHVLVFGGVGKFHNVQPSDVQP